MNEKPMDWSKIFLAAILLFAIAMFTGCASYKVKDASGKVISECEAIGFLRTITVVEKYNKAGTVVVERRISTESTTKDVLMGLNEFVDTATETAAKLKP